MATKNKKAREIAAAQPSRSDADRAVRVYGNIEQGVER